MGNTLKKAALFTDLHFGRRNNSEEHNKDCSNFIDWFCQQVKNDPTIDHIQFLGDWHEHRSNIAISTLKYSYEAAKKLSKLGLPVFWLSGNHDYFLRESSDIFSTYHFESLENFYVMNKITLIEDIYGGVLFVPFINESEYENLLKYKDIPYISGHLELKGFKVTGTGNVMEHGPDSDLIFKTQKRIFSGHFHQRQTKNNVCYIGNTFPMDFSDANDTDRGMAVYDYEFDDLKFINWKEAPKFVKAKLSDLLENPKSIIKQNARVSIDVDIELTYDESLKIKKSLQEKYNLRDIVLNETLKVNVDATDIEQELDDEGITTTNEIITALLKKVDDDIIDTELLVSLYSNANINDSMNDCNTINVDFLSLSFSNFLSYGNNLTTVDLSTSDPTLIIGRNYDSIVEGQVDSNGAGKTTILQALLLCLYGKNLIDATLDEQINNCNKKNMYISTIFKANDVYYKVERYRKNKTLGGDGVRLYVNENEPVFNNEHNKTLDSVSNTEKRIALLLGIPYEMFIRIIVFSATHQPFLSLPSSHASKANQREIIEELFGLSEISSKAEALKIKLSDHKLTLKELLKINEIIENERIRRDNQISINITRHGEWEKDRNDKLDLLNEQATELKSINVDENLKKFDNINDLTIKTDELRRQCPILNSELSSITSENVRYKGWEEKKLSELNFLNKELDKLSSIDVDELMKVRTQKLSSIQKHSQLKLSLLLLKKELSTLNDNLASNSETIKKMREEQQSLSNDECPYCHQKFTEGNQSKLDHCTSNIKNLLVKNDTIEKKLSEISIDIETITAEYNQIETIISSLNKIDIPEDLDDVSNKLIIIKEKILSLSESKNPYTNDETSVNKLKKAMNSLSNKIDKFMFEISEIKLQIPKKITDKNQLLVIDSELKNIKTRIQELKQSTNPFDKVIASLKEEKIDDLKTVEIDRINKEIKHLDFLIKMLTKKDSFIRKVLLNKNLPLLNTRLRYYLDKVGLPHKVTFNEEMSVDISQFDSEYNYNLFSTGQKARVNICLAFAFRDVLQSRFGKINLCILDECLDNGLGVVGVTLVSKMIKAIAKENNLSMFVISHKDEILNTFTKKLEIELRNGFSEIL